MADGGGAHTAAAVVVPTIGFDGQQVPFLDEDKNPHPDLVVFLRTQLFANAQDMVERRHDIMRVVLPAVSAIKRLPDGLAQMRKTPRKYEL